MEIAKLELIKSDRDFTESDQFMSLEDFIKVRDRHFKIKKEQEWLRENEATGV